MNVKCKQAFCAVAFIIFVFFSVDLILVICLNKAATIYTEDIRSFTFRKLYYQDTSFLGFTINLLKGGAYSREQISRLLHATYTNWYIGLAVLIKPESQPPNESKWFIYPLKG